MRRENDDDDGDVDPNTSGRRAFSTPMSSVAPSPQKANHVTTPSTASPRREGEEHRAAEITIASASSPIRQLVSTPGKDDDDDN